MARITVTLVIVIMLIGMIPAPPSQADTAVRVGQVKHTTSADFALGSLDGTVISTQEDGEITVGSGQNQGQFTSPVVKTDFEFNAVGLIWHDEVPELAQLEFEMRTSRDGRTWKDWRLVEDGDAPSKTGEHSSELFFTFGSYVQYRLNLVANERGRSPVVRDVSVKYIDSTSGPDLAAAIRSAAVRTLDVVPSSQPTIISRAAWGLPSSCPNNRLVPAWPPEYVATKTAVIHHTDTPIDTDPVAAVRAIWTDHACLRDGTGWGDIGYNYLIDAAGTIYEGRYGGDNVVAAHVGGIYNYGSLGVAVIGTYASVPPGPLSSAAVVNLLAWKLNRFGIDPKGAGWFYDKWVNNVAGHLDVSATACPGSALYVRLPGLRNLTKFKTGWGAHSTPQRMLAGQTIWVSVAVQNQGAGTWTSGGSYPFDLGYHWYNASGNQYSQSPLDDHRTAVPQAVGYDQWVTFNALLTAPTVPGTYTLQWDMVQEYVAWFAAYGSSPLVTTVVVEQPTLTATATPSATATATATATPTGTPTATATPVPPTLVVEPAFIGFVMRPGASPRPQQIQIRNAGTGTFQWQASPNQSWLRVQPSSGSPGGSLEVSIDLAALSSVTPPEARDGHILIQASDAVGSPETVPVRLAIASQIYQSYFPGAYRSYTSGW